MTQGYDYRKYAILFVDDESQALLLFEKMLGTSFSVLTAGSVAEAWKIIEAQHQRIGIVITDQRMPAETGVELLERLNVEHPQIVRILTTAYSDLRSAIAAVNAGGIHQYITKPWNLEELRATLRHAMEYFLIRKERDRLLKDKLYVLHRILVMDRVRGLASLAAALGCRLRDSLGALKAYVHQAPVHDTGAVAVGDLAQADLRAIARTEGERLVRVVQSVFADTVLSPSWTTVDLSALVRGAAESVRPDQRADGIRIVVEAQSELPQISTDEAMLRRLVGMLVGRIARTHGDNCTITCQLSTEHVDNGTPAIHLRIAGDVPPWDNKQLKSLHSAIVANEPSSADPDMDILSAFFIAHHLGGSLQVLHASCVGAGFDLLLRLNPKVGSETTLGKEWFDDVFADLEECDPLGE
jgi:two-component system, probable response regulator PhcQ